ncbi:glycosyltransferase family 2 protein [Desulfuromonas sp. TF]|uniref:glycosyltransferase family 2 protein n=1 Tax=Desulfuromonas sp. TF TaxID=1232410 RepID=UPI000488D79C|nr:glycosyltransferase family 2 protein [Desulfuromonas sp. TF]
MPIITVGMPVYNGEEFIRDALDSILSQTFPDFELIISDNASTDGMQKICREYAESDARIRYVRNPENIGAARNYNQVFRMARGKYFHWAAHDDAFRPEYLARCLEVLEKNPDLVLCFTQEVGIDERGNTLAERPYRLDTSLALPEDRFLELLKMHRGSPPIFGLMRADILRQTSLIGSYDGSDQVLLAELALHGRFRQIGENLFLHREHAGRSVHRHRGRHSVTVWFDTANAGKIVFPRWRWFWEYFRVIRKSPITLHQQWRCALHVLRWVRFRDNVEKMIEDIRIGSRSFAALLRYKLWS